MNGPLRLAHDQPLTVEGAKLYLVLEEVDRIVVTLQTLHDATIQRETDRQDATLAAQRGHSIAEKALAASISKAVILNIYAELTPLLKEDLKEERERNAAASSALAKEMTSSATGIIRDNAAVIADAVAGKPPLPPLPPEDARLLEKATGHAIRCLAEAKRFMVSATHPLVWFTCCVVLYAAAHSLKLW
ncbi:hypothetical protein [Caballeronia sordidicola]|uniref:hypothetical protein n=1 Tax=Caballeronia sordidicola TaxID=196367 RepID=UPI00126A7668|nr:hypothetical protein [Caballeronia sordidicola]